MNITKYIHRSKRTTVTPPTTGFGRLYNSYSAQKKSVRFGALYNRYAIENLPNTGWHLPNYLEALTLMEYTAGQMMSVDSKHWDTTYATDAFGLALVGGGIRRQLIGYMGKRERGWVWIWDDESNAFSFLLQNDSNIIVFDQGDMSYTDGLSVRLVKDSTLLTEENPFGTYTGNDGRVYRTCLIDGKEWLAENLAETKYKNGTSIPIVESLSAWGALSTGAMCYYDNDISNESDFLIASDGWRLPFESEWSDIENTPAELKSTSSTYWDTPGTDDVNFSLRGSGTRSGLTGAFSGLKTSFKAWCADSLRAITIDSSIAFSTVTKTTGCAIRLVKENLSTEDALKSDGDSCDNYVGNDGQVYPTVKLAGKVWLAMNLQETRLRQGASIATVTESEDWIGIGDHPAIGDNYEGGEIASITVNEALIVASIDEYYNYENALLQAASSELEGFTDWLLPTVSQIETIISVRTLLSSFIQNNVFWTREDVDEFSAYNVDMATPEFGISSKNSTCSLMLVRFAQLDQQPASCIYDNSASNLIDIDNIVVHNGAFVTHNGDYVIHS